MTNESTSSTLPALDTNFNPKRLGDAGLSEADIPAVLAIVASIDPTDRASINALGRSGSESGSDLTDRLLEQVKTNDLDKSGQLLSEVVTVARSVNLNALTGKRSSLPIIGPLIDRFRTSRDKFVQQFSSTREQIEVLLGEIGVTQTGLDQRVQALDEMYDAVREQHHELGVCLVAGEIRIEQLRDEIDALASGSDSGLQALKRQDLTQAVHQLDKRVGDLRVLQQSALQSLPTIRLIQSNNAMLVEKFHNIRELTIPAWKRQFMLAVSLNEQQSAVRLAENIDDATNELLIRNAKLTRENAVATARSNQRLVIDVETLEKVQAELIGTVQDVIRVHHEGVQAREAAEQKILAMRSDLERQLAGPEVGQDPKALAGTVH